MANTAVISATEKIASAAVFVNRLSYVFDTETDFIVEGVVFGVL